MGILIVELFMLARILINISQIWSQMVWEWRTESLFIEKQKAFVRSHISWREERSILFKGVGTSL